MPGADRINRRITEAQTLLAALGMPPAQRNTVCALALLALLNLTPDRRWIEAGNPPRGVHVILGFSDQHYGTSWAENTRETFRKDAIHYFEAAQLVVKNPDDPNRPTNSGKTVYQVTDAALALIRKYGAEGFAEALPIYLASVGALADRYASRRTLKRVPLRLALDLHVTLSAGPHSELIERIIYQFGPRFTPDGRLIYAGDTGRKWDSYFDEDLLQVKS